MLQQKNLFCRVPINYPELANKKLAELIGILLGDGCIRKNEVKIVLNRDELSYVEYINNLMSDLFSIKGKVRFKRNENAIELRTFNKNLVDFLTNKVGLSLAPKKNRAIMPQYIIGTELEKYLLRGLFDTDGCFAIVNNDGTPYIRIELKAEPSPMRDSLIAILKKRKFRFGAYKIKNNLIRIQLNGYQQFFRWIKEIGVRNPKQKEKITNFIIAGVGFEPTASRPTG